MKALAWIVALVFMTLGLVGIVAPDTLMAVARHMLTPGGLHGLAALRVGMGLALILAAPRSRAPRTLRAFGAAVLVAGLVTPLLGVDRAQGMAEWAAAQGPALIRGVGAVILAIGGGIAFAVAGDRRG